MKKVILAVLVASVLAGCEDMPFEPGGEDDFSTAARHQARSSHEHGGMDDGLLRTAARR